MDMSDQLHTMAPLSLGKSLVPTKKQAGWGPIMLKDGKKLKEIKLSNMNFGQRDGVAWLVDNRHSMEMSRVSFSIWKHKQGITQQ